MYHQQHWTQTQLSCGRGLLRAGASLPPNGRLQESHEQTQGVGRASLCRGQRLARDETLSLAAAVASQLPSPGDCHRTESQTVAPKTRMGTASLSSSGGLCWTSSRLGGG